MSWRTSAYRLVSRLRGDRHLEILEGLRASERWSPDRLREAQRVRLRTLLLHAYEHVPYYREPLVASGVVTGARHPRVDLSRFERLPLLTRADIRAHADELRDRRLPSRGSRTTVVTTGGTTGDVLRVVRNPAAYQHAIAVQLWFDEWSGCALGEPKVVFGGRRHTIPDRVRGRIAAVLRNEVRLDVSRLSEALIAAHLDRINQVRPAQVIGRPSVLFEVARYAEATGRRLVPVRAVMVSAEAITPEMEAAIRRVFGAPVFNRYGTSELGGVACGCGQEPRLHVSTLTHHVEVLREDGRPCGPGETGELVITLLTNSAMPLIRYRIGDLSTPGPTADPCGCGRTLPSIGDVSGRVLDSFVTPRGDLVNAFVVRRVYRHVPWIRQFQMVQLAPTHVHVRLVEQDLTADPMSARRDDLDLIARHLRSAIAPECAVTFEFLEEIPRERTGKYRATIRLIPDGDLPVGAGNPAARRPAGGREDRDDATL